MIQKFYKHGKILKEEDYNSLGEMIMDSDLWTTEEYLTKDEILKKYGSSLTEEQLKTLHKTN